MTRGYEIESDVYRLFDGEGRLLYVGMTCRGVCRWVQHSAMQSWWERVALVTVAHFTDRFDAAEEEIRAIQVERPEFNTMRYDNVPANRGIYAPRRTGSVYRASRTGKFIASIRWYGRRYTSREYVAREDAEAWLREFLASQAAV